jgi:hypothetical protein
MPQSFQIIHQLLQFVRTDCTLGEGRHHPEASPDLGLNQETGQRFVVQGRPEAGVPVGMTLVAVLKKDFAAWLQIDCPRSWLTSERFSPASTLAAHQQQRTRNEKEESPHGFSLLIRQSTPVPFQGMDVFFSWFMTPKSTT